MRFRQLFLLFFVALLGHASGAAEQSASQSILLASTTSVENSGLLAHILPDFTKETGIEVHVWRRELGRRFRRPRATMPI
jgi:tungstate transport system substrate-binding protein